MNNEATALRQRLRRARLVRRFSVFFFLAPLLVWGVAFASVLAGQQQPDDGFGVLAVLYYGLFASPLLIIPVLAFFVFSRRIHTLERQLMFSSAAAP